LQQQWRIPNDGVHGALARTILACCNPHQCNRIVRIPAMGIGIFVFNSWPAVRRIGDSVLGGNRPVPADDLTKDIYRSLQAMESAIVIREDDDGVVLAANSAMDAFNGIYEQAKGTRDAVLDLALAMEPVLTPLETIAA